MSNYVSSTIRIDRSKYTKLVKDAAKAAAQALQIAQQKKENEELAAALAAANNRINTAQHEFDNLWAALSEANANNEAMDEALREEIDRIYNASMQRIQGLATSTQQSIDNLRVDLANLVKDSIESNNQFITDAINRSNQALTDMINDVRANTAAAIAAVNNRLDVLNNGATELLNSAYEYMLQVRNLQNAIAGTRHEMLLPGRYARVRDAVNLAESNVALAQTNPMNTPVARDRARAAFEESIRFLEEIAIAEQEWQAQLAITEQISSIVAEQIESSRTIEPRPGKEQDVDYWSNNGISDNFADYEKLRDVLKKPDRLTTEQLADLQQAFGQLSESVDTTVANAFARCATSQNITVVAERIHRELNAVAGLRVTAHSFEGGDNRGNYRYILQAETGLTVVVTISVTESEEGLEIKPEADIVGYGTMPVQEAENLVRAAMERVSGAGRTSCTETPGATVLHPEREHFDEWKRPHEVQHTPDIQQHVGAHKPMK
ncbi:MAG: hypothetical protein IIW48_12985 [Clostridia bacterium]|nr:hypothetical protein [Clostridia bacterium]